MEKEKETVTVDTNPYKADINKIWAKLNPILEKAYREERIKAEKEEAGETVDSINPYKDEIENLQAKLFELLDKLYQFEKERKMVKR